MLPSNFFPYFVTWNILILAVACVYHSLLPFIFIFLIASLDDLIVTHKTENDLLTFRSCCSDSGFQFHEVKCHLYADKHKLPGEFYGIHPMIEHATIQRSHGAQVIQVN